MVGYFETQADNPVQAVKFCENVFRWSFAEENGLPIKYRRIMTGDGIRGGLPERLARTPAANCGTTSFACSIEMEDFDRTGHVILENDWQIALPKFAVPGVCRQGYFIDNQNNVFGIFQTDAAAGIV